MMGKVCTLLLVKGFDDIDVIARAVRHIDEGGLGARCERHERKREA